MVINGYNIAPEIISKVIIYLVAFMMAYSKPRRNRMLLIEWVGLILSFLAISLNINVIYLSNMPEKVASGFMEGVMFAFLFMYSMVLSDIFAYIIYFSYGGNIRMTSYWIGSTTLIACFVAVCGFFKITGYLYQVKPDGRADLTGFIGLYVTLGLLICIAAGVIIFARRKRLPRALLNYCKAFMPAFAVLVVVQLRWKSIMMLGTCYVLPFLIFYILFHASVYDEVSGCQNFDAFQTRMIERLRLKRAYSAVAIDIPQLKGWSKLGSDKTVSSIIIDATRRIENANKRARIHRLGETSYVVCVDYNELERVKELVDMIEMNVKESLSVSKHPINYHIIAVRSHASIKNLHMLDSMFMYFMAMLQRVEGSQVLISEEKDYQAFSRSYMIMQNLIDIRRKGDLNDPRILCYAQPVYDVKTGQFRSAEVLTRMELNGEVIMPYEFIPIAEQSNCIHVITKIALNKTCQMLQEVQEKKSFDVISFNCNMEELGTEAFNDDILSIVEKYGIDKKHIRLELTESMMSQNYELVKKNMRILQSNGVHFHLDDFGTGFSNIERVMDCNFRTIKFDKSMLYKAMDDPRMDELITYMVEIFKRYRVNVIIEGVENKKQEAYSIEHGFDRIQGYYYSEPVPMREAFDKFAPK